MIHTGSLHNFPVLLLAAVWSQEAFARVGLRLLIDLDSIMSTRILQQLQGERRYVL